MKKRTVRLTESDLHKIIKESVKNVLNEDGFGSIRRNGWQDRLNQIHQLALEMLEISKNESEDGYGRKELYNTAKSILQITERWGGGINM